MSGGAAPSLLEAVAAQALSPETDGALAAAMERFAAAAGDGLEGCIYFGSRRTGAARANAFSAYDLFAVVTDYRYFYQALRRAGLTGKSPRLLALISRVLPPTQISVVFREPELHAKVSVIRSDTLVRETSAKRHDHFTIGRLFQPTRILAARSAEARERLLAAVVSAHFETWWWSRPWLPPSFDADGYGRRVLEISMSWEVRPEPEGRAAALWEAQRAAQRPVFEALLRELEAAGEVRAVGPTTAGGPSAAIAGAPAGPVAAATPWTVDGRGSISRTQSVGWVSTKATDVLERLQLRTYFTSSMLRATARWGKHVLSFEGWLDYIVRKANRHAGEPIELTDRERRWPLVFLWGRVFRYLRQKNRKDVKP